jgi:hypothetical protein
MSTVWNSVRGTLFWLTLSLTGMDFQENKLNSKLGPSSQSLQIYPQALLQRYSIQTIHVHILHCIITLPILPSPAGMSLTKLSLAENNLIIPGQGEFS